MQQLGTFANFRACPSHQSSASFLYQSAHYTNSQELKVNDKPPPLPSGSRHKSNRMVRKPLLPIASSVLDTLQLDMATLLQSNLPAHSGISSLQAHTGGLPDHDRPVMQHPQHLNNTSPPTKSELWGVLFCFLFFFCCVCLNFDVLEVLVDCEMVI